MSQKGITINTTDAGHVDASDHALLFSAIFGMNGILNVGSKMEISKQSDNKIRIMDGMYMMSNGVLIRIENYEDITITSGTLGQKLIDETTMTIDSVSAKVMPVLANAVFYKD